MATRIKSKAAAFACNTREEAQTAIRQIGDLQRQHLRKTTEVNDAIAKISEAAAPEIDALNERIKTLQAGVQTWCEANREKLCGKGKSANLITGEVAWRNRPPSVSITKAEAVIEALKRLGLERFVREKEEINKEAILAEKDAVAGVKGIKVNKDVEDFVITPFEIEVEAA